MEGRRVVMRHYFYELVLEMELGSKRKANHTRRSWMEGGVPEGRLCARKRCGACLGRSAAAARRRATAMLRRARRGGRARNVEGNNPRHARRAEKMFEAQRRSTRGRSGAQAATRPSVAGLC